MTLVIDGSVSASTTTTNPTTAVLTTTMTNDIIVGMIYLAGNTSNPSVGSITDTAGLTWTKRTSVAAPSGFAVLEIWWAYSSGALTSTTITMTGSGGGGINGVRVTYFGVNGANTTTPFDVNVGVPVSTTTSSATTLTNTISTTNPNTMLLSFLRSTQTLGTITPAAGFTSVVAVGANQYCSYDVVSSAQSNTPVTFSWTGATASAAMIVDALQASGAFLLAGTASTTGIGNGTASVIVGAASSGTSPYTYQWYRSTTSGFTPGAGNIVSGATSLTLNDTGLTNGTTYYYVNVVTDSVSATANSNQTSATPAIISPQPYVSDWFGTKGPTVNNNAIGGVAIGAQGSTGIYSGYTMVGGDDFNDNLNVVSINTPNAKYFTTHVYGAGARSVNGLLAFSYDMDPYHTGSQDSNMGKPVGTNTLRQQSSVMSLQARAANSSETPYTNTRLIVSSMIHTGGYITPTAPCIIEALVSFTAPATNPQGWHPTFWLLNTNPMDNPQTGSPGWLEFDFPECSSQYGAANTNTHGTVPGGWISDSTSMQANNVMGTGFHLYSLVITSASVLWYMDGVLIKTESHDGTITANPYYILFTSHTYNNTYNGDSGVNPTAWANATTRGATMNVDYYRVWVPTSSPTVLTPLVSLPNLQVSYNTSMTYVFPSVAALWGASFAGTDYCGACKFEDFEPGSSVEASGSYGQFPAGLTFNSGTRTLTGVTTDQKPGRMHTVCTPYLASGALGYVARGHVDVGPNVTATTATYSNATGSLNMYFIGDCGTLVPKTMSITGLPAGLSFSPTTFLITGTATTGSYVINMSVTNAVSQNATGNITLTVTA